MYVVVMVLDSIRVENFHYLQVKMSSVHIDDKKKDILILGTGPTQELEDTTLSAEVQYSINFSRSNRKFQSSL